MLPIPTRGERLSGVLLFAGELPAGGAARGLLRELQRQLATALAAPLPAPRPEVLTLPLDRIDVPGGADVVEREFLGAVLTRHGGNMSRTALALDLPRQTLHDRLRRLGARASRMRVQRTLPARLPLRDEALELERDMCRQILERSRGDFKLGAVLLDMTTAAWRAYVQDLGVDPPPRPRRAVHRRQR